MGQVVAYDYGIKHNILRRLASMGCRVTVVPADYPAKKVLEMNPDGVFLSNGPVRAPDPHRNMDSDRGSIALSEEPRRRPACATARCAPLAAEQGAQLVQGQPCSFLSSVFQEAAVCSIKLCVAGLLVRQRAGSCWWSPCVGKQRVTKSWKDTQMCDVSRSSVALQESRVLTVPQRR